MGKYEETKELRKKKNPKPITFLTYCKNVPDGLLHIIKPKRKTYLFSFDKASDVRIGVKTA